MPKSLLKINISNELDVVLAYKRAMQLSEKTGMAQANQTKFATAVSEICRNVVEHVGNGTIQFGIIEEKGHNYLEAKVSDRGRGIGNLDQIYERASYGSNVTGRGMGIVNSRKLVDFFDIKSEHEQGTSVTLRKRIPAQSPVFTKSLQELWLREFNDEEGISPYAEIKKQNMQQLELLEKLRLRNLEAEQQLQEIRRLNLQLQQSNFEIQSLSEERERRNLELQQANADLDAFAHTVSHDLRAPLQNIGGIINFMENSLRNGNSEDAASLLPMLREQASKMDKLITGILAYSLAGHHSLHRQIVPLRSVLQKVLESLYVPATFKIIFPENLPTLYTQEIYLYQIFSNLLGNAVKYHDRPEEAEIAVQYDLKSDFIYIAVQDNGPGIAPEDQEQIFRKYEALGHNLTRPDSSGLGLAIVKRILEEKQGDVWVESTGRGTRFVFSWPASEIVTEPEEAE
ncbi:ATP-binding protein [Pontibacter lucknowensis]|uniref:histidine kinase n=1 Tax=Pontibacter lucknowensis TaxID=1077936 RepID=A0A1N6Z7E5_9BACT|nr:ATP-binding protein [Pontibacter lucknowensis]SIR22707.1 His Kinase A (phospho-acceptor) domain-containing protein [Pontibacter lucknowensis]